MRLDLLKGPLLLLLWQTAPVSVEPDSSGRLQLTVGWGAGQFEQRELSCQGEVLSATPVPFRVGGAQVDYHPTEDVRLSGFGGVTSFGATKSGWGGFQAAIEAGGLGLGLGVARTPFEDFRTMPSVYLRLGNREGGHFRLDMFHPTATLGVTGDVIRVGAGFNQGLRRGHRGFLGFNVGPFADQSNSVGVFGEWDVPLATQITLSVAGSVRPSAQHFDGGARAVVRYHLGR